MVTKSIINLFQTQPKAVLDLVSALQHFADGSADPQSVRSFLYPAANDARERWNEFLDAGESLGLLSKHPLRASVADHLNDEDEAFGRFLRRRFRQEEREQGTNSLVYIAYRAALELEPDLDGGTLTKLIIDRAEERAKQALGPTSQRRYDEDKMVRWRWWISAAGLGLPGQRAQTYVICPVLALRDELAARERSLGEVPLGDFLASFGDIPLLPGDDDRGEVPVGTGVALRICEEESLVRLVHRPDARRQWRIPGRSITVTHVEVVT